MRWLLVVILAATAACASKPACKLVPVPASSRGPAFLWRAHKGGDVVWLFGTIHSSGLERVPREALAALDASKRLVTELGAETPDPDEFRKHARIASGPGIDQQLPSSDWYDLRDALLGKVKEDDLRRAQPWYAMSLLTTYMAPKPGPSMDVALTDRAETRGIAIDPLESWTEQLQALTSAVDLGDLQEAIHARATMRCDLARLDASYSAGDTATMEALLVIPATKDTMLNPRNQKWLPKLEAYFTSGGAFVAVGLGHLLGDQGLPAMLQRAGYTVERTTAQ